MFKGFWQRKQQQEKRPRANLQIKSPQVRVIDEETGPLGIMDTPAAMKLAQEKGLDLIEVDPNANPPIAKILDYGKYMYRKEKSGKNKKAGIQEIKTVRIGIKTGEHDLMVKSALADKFLEKKNKVRIEIFLKGREKAFRNIAREKLNGFLGYISQPHIIEEAVKFTPTGFSVIIKPEK